VAPRLSALGLRLFQGPLRVIVRPHRPFL
jgi:hypothetical protein